MLATYIFGLITGLIMTGTNYIVAMATLESDIGSKRNYNGLHTRKKQINEDLVIWASTSIIWPVFVIWLTWAFIVEKK